MGSLRMKAFPLFTALLAILLTSLGLRAEEKPTLPARTWVSGVGDDANPGSRTAPCKTFDGAISKTKNNGEISVLDPGSFESPTAAATGNAVSITKSLTISGEGTLTSILASDATGVVINAEDNSVVVLRSLSIEAARPGLAGIRIVKAGAVYVENCTIHGFQTGISFESSSPNAQLFVNHCRIRKCFNAGNGSGIFLAGSGGTASKIEDTTVEGCDAGIVLKSGVATIKDSTAAGNRAQGFHCGSGALITIEGCVSSQNQVGIRAAGSVILSNTTVAANEADGLLAIDSGSIISYGNNRVTRNSPNGKPTNTVQQQ
jgi:nitrous oxidase accessory protein NosD